ncbi:hypothetical protein AB0D91_43585 [Streptomyces canus]|uniref:hypothetical protein n=1 Tax=Streptomyces canus TaxID=58343 RepID=UPI003402C9EA
MTSRTRRFMLCAAIVHRITFGGNIIETGTGWYWLAHTRAAQSVPCAAGAAKSSASQSSWARPILP